MNAGARKPFVSILGCPVKNSINQFFRGHVFGRISLVLGDVVYSRRIIAKCSRLLGISKKTLHRLCREGRIAYVEINDKERRFRPDQIQEYIERRTVPARIDCSAPSKVNSPRKGGRKKKSVKDSRADLRKEMSQWQ